MSPREASEHGKPADDRFTATPLPHPTASQPVRPMVWLYLVLSPTLLAGSWWTEGELASFLRCSWGAVPFAVLGLLAYLGLERRWARILARFWFAGLLLGGVIFDVGLAVLALAQEHTADGDFTLPDGAGGKVGLVLLAALLAALVPLAAGAPLRRRLPGPEASVRRLAVVTALSLTGLAIVPLVVLGEPPLLAWFGGALEAGLDPYEGRGQAGLLRDELYSLCWTLPAALFVIGYGVRRDLRAALERLGVARPSARMVVAAVALTGTLLGASWIWDEAIATLWHRAAWPTTDADTVDALFAFALDPLGAIVIGVVAGVGEEVAVRGVLQPRLGIALSNLFFTALHAWQYQWDGLFSVLLTGTALGVIRKRSNTTVSAMVHGGYDFVLLMTAAFEQ